MNWLRECWTEFWRDRLSNRLLGTGVGLYLVALAGVWWLGGGWPASIQQLPPEFPLFYSLPRGVEQLATMRDLWLAAMWLGVIISVDLILAVLLMGRFRVLAYTILWTAILSIGLWGFGVLRVYLLVG